MEIKEEKTINIEHCARCGQNHFQLYFRKFENSIQDTDGTEWAYWSICPIKGEPILLKVEEKE